MRSRMGKSKFKAGFFKDEKNAESQGDFIESATILAILQNPQNLPQQKF